MLIEDTMNDHTILSDTIKRIRQLRDNVIDLSIVLDDLDREIAPLLVERADHDTRLRDAEHELAELLRRWAA
jgi:ACT domain-containing protein